MCSHTYTHASITSKFHTSRFFASFHCPIETLTHLCVLLSNEITHKPNKFDANKLIEFRNYWIYTCWNCDYYSFFLIFVARIFAIQIRFWEERKRIYRDLFKRNWFIMLKSLRERSQKRKKLLAQTVSKFSANSIWINLNVELVAN